MIDHKILPLQHNLLAPLANWIARKATADQITCVAFGFGILAFVSICLGAYGVGLFFILVNRLGDGLDGMVARINGPTQRGAYFDIVFDFAFYALIPLGFAVSQNEFALPAAVLIASFIGTGSAFLAFAVIAEKLKIRAKEFPSKGIYYLGGLTEGFETIMAFVLMCLFPHWFSTIAYLFAAACVMTTVTRWHYAWIIFDKTTKDIK